MSKIGPALMAGNAVVLKPPSQGAVAGAHMVQCLAAAGAPPGLLQMITGRGGEIGDYLTTHAAVNAISFTGGDTGLAVARKAGMVALQMELGGKDAAIVCADADLDLAAKVWFCLVFCVFFFWLRVTQLTEHKPKKQQLKTNKQTGDRQGRL